MTEQLEKTLKILSPLDWGLAFALGNSKKLFALAAVPFAVELFISFYLLQFPVPPQQMFVLTVS